MRLMIRLNKAAAQAGVMHWPAGETVIGRTEVIANTTGNLIRKIVKVEFSQFSYTANGGKPW